MTGVAIAQPVQIVPANPLPAPRSSAPASPSLPEPLSETELELETELEFETEAEMEPLISPAAEGTTTQYSDEAMSINFPADWEVETIENGIMIANVTTDEAALIATQVVRMAAPPGPVVDANIDSFIEEGAAVGRYKTATIDDRSSLVIWLSERPGTLSSAIATFIDYGDETILLLAAMRLIMPPPKTISCVCTLLSQTWQSIAKLNRLSRGFMELAVWIWLASAFSPTHQVQQSHPNGYAAGDLFRYQA